MKKRISTLILLLSICFSFAQHTVEGVISPVNEYTYIVLYQLKGAKQQYIANTNFIDGSFKLSIPENTESGMYRLLYDLENNGFIDFIYNNENVIIKFNPDSPSLSKEFENSIENSLYFEYLAKSEQLIQSLDSLQLAYLSMTNDQEKILTQTKYNSSLRNYKDLQNNFEEKSANLFAQHFIKSDRRFYPINLLENAQLFFNSRKGHFFDFIDFNNNSLLNSTFLSQKIVDYVFYMNRSEDIKVQNLLYQQAIDKIATESEINPLIKKELLTVLLYTFAQIENTEQIDYIIEKHYRKLPESIQDQQTINDVLDRVKFAIGRLAPDFNWDINGEKGSLYGMDSAETYILVFWSTDCSHCLTEIPPLYEFTKSNDSIHVIAYALENDEKGFNIHTEKLNKWTNILGLDKWENSTSQAYDITETPTYFILDSSKRIISKPEFFRDVKAFYESK